MGTREVRRIETPTPRDGSKLIYSEGINYFATSTESIWGEDGSTLLSFIDKADPHGIWLNLASGDGRYCKRLLRDLDCLVASDIDPSALSKLWHRMTEEERQRLALVELNLTQRLPFQDGSFDGIFCVGTLHFFNEEILSRVFGEIERITKPGGKVLMNFGTNIQRVQPNGERLVYPGELQHKLGTALPFLKDSFRAFRTEFHVEDTRAIPFMEANPPYTYRSDIVVILAEK